jgi:FkbM family methyltransferase
MTRLESAVRRLKQAAGLSGQSPLVSALRPAYDHFLGAVYGRHGLPRRFPGESPVRIRPRYRSLSANAEPGVFAALKSRVRPADVVLDVGANLGVYSLLMGRWVGDAGRVFAFEPAPLALAALRDHIALNGLAGRVEAVGRAVGDRTGEATFYAHSYNGENSLNAGHARRVAAARPTRVPVITIDAFCEAERIAPALIKIDVEGWELHALRGARATLARCRPAVVVELHPSLWPEVGVCAAEAADVLAHLGCRAVSLDGRADSLAAHGHVILEACK